MSNVEIPRLEYAFSVRIEFKERLRFEPTTPMGGRVYVPVTGGIVSGPRLQGRVMPYSGADWARGRADAVAELNAHYMLEASDGTPIYLYNRGYLYGRDDQGRPLTPAPGGAAKDGFAIKPNTYFFITPVFDTPVGPHDWLTRNSGPRHAQARSRSHDVRLFRGDQLSRRAVRINSMTTEAT